MRLHPPPDHSHEREHPIVAWIGVAAIVIAVLLIIWARFEVRDTADLESAFGGQAIQPKPASKPKGQQEERAKKSEAENAAAKSRWATGFSH